MFDTIADKPRWALALDVFRDHHVGDVVAYADIAAVLDKDDRATIQSAAREAGKRLLIEDGHAIEAVPNKGYRIVAPDEHIRLARGHEKRSRKALVRGHATVQNVDLNGLSEESKRVVLATAAGFSRVLDMMRQTNKNVARVARAQEALELRVDEGLSENAERLARLEAQVQALYTPADTSVPG
jgi:hypothetical protein